MMQQQSTKKLARPRLPDVFFHGIKTAKLMGSLLVDRRVPVLPKFFFLGTIALLLIILIFPDVLGEAILSVVLPAIGTVLGIPVDAGFDWLVFVPAVLGLLRFFPAELVAEHYSDIFG